MNGLETGLQKQSGPFRGHFIAKLCLFLLGILLFTGSLNAQTSSLNPPQTFTEENELETSNFLVGGIQMNEGDQQNWIRTLKESGMNTVQVTVYAHQGRWHENNLWFNDYDQSLIQEIRYAKAAGLKVVLVLRLQLDHNFQDNKFLWHGMVFPHSLYLVQRWFEEYTRFAKRWAEICEEEGVEVLVIGSEMNELFATLPIETMPKLHEYYLNDEKQERYRTRMLKFSERLTERYLSVAGDENYKKLELYLDDQIKANQAWAKMVTFQDSLDPLAAMNYRRTVLNWYWERMIYDIRGVYNGKMTIAANFDNYNEVRFWDKLDYIGINAYFPLRTPGISADKPKKFQKALEKSWDQTLDEILEFREAAGVPNHPILFTELGYGRHSGSTLTPWQGFGFSLLRNPVQDSLIIWEQQPEDPKERNLAVLALYEAVKKKEFPLAGILYWKLTSKKEQLVYDPFALHIGKETEDELQQLLVKFKFMEAEIKAEKMGDRKKR